MLSKEAQQCPFARKDPHVPRIDVFDRSFETVVDFVFVRLPRDPDSHHECDHASMIHGAS